jgi:hypothetical protein
MKRTLTALLVAAASTTLLAGPAIAAPASSDRDVSGPACLDVLDGLRSYVGDQLTVTLQLAAPACKFATYQLTVEDAGTSTTYVPTSFDASGNPVFAVTTSGETFVCVTATTSIGKRVFDRAPDENCIEVANDGSSPGVRMR